MAPIAGAILRCSSWIFLSRLLNTLQLDRLLLNKLYYFQFVQNFDYLIRRIDLVPAYTPKVSAGSVLVMIVVITLSHHQEVHW